MVLEVNIRSEGKKRMKTSAIQLLLLMSMSVFGQEKYKQYRKNLLDGKLSLYWGTEYDRIYFKIEAKDSKQVLFLFSYNEVPTDGFVAGIDGENNEILRDLHLDFAGLDKTS